LEYGGDGFKKIKAIRDTLLRGENVDESSLPTEEI
jgi:hypothetical protein